MFFTRFFKNSGQNYGLLPMIFRRLFFSKFGESLPSDLPQKHSVTLDNQSLDNTAPHMETIAASLAEARALLSAGDTGKALQTLIAALDREPRFAAAERTLRVLQTNFAAVRQQELKGILSFAEAQREYSRVVDAALVVVDDVEVGRVPAVVADGRRRAWIFGGTAVFVLGAAAAFFLLRNRPKCPDFERDRQVKILVLPFQNVGSLPARPAIALQNRIRDLTKRNGLSASVGVLSNYDADRENPDPAAATALCLRCMADLVVWGQYSVGGDSSRIAIQYKFVADGREGATDVLAFKDITGLQSGRMVKGFDDAIFSLCGMIAMREKRWDLAEKWLGKVREPDATDFAMRDWLAKNRQ